MKTACLLFSLSAWAAAETHPLTLRQAVDLALKQNPELVLSRLDEQRARASIRIARDPFVPKLYGGSGLAFTHGYPNSIEGSAPSIFQARTEMALFNRPKTYELAQARENARGAGIDTASKSEDVAYRTASFFLDARQAGRRAESIRLEIKSLEQVNEAMQLRVQEGREIPLAGKRSALDLARGRQRAESLLSEAEDAEESLAAVLGFPAGDRIQPMDEERPASTLPATEEESVTAALANSKEVRRIESQMTAKGFEVQAQKSQRYPQFDLVAQYALFAKHNYQDYFGRFSRNNAQLGVSIRVPLLLGSAPSGLQAQAETDLARLRVQMTDLRNRTALDARKSFHAMQRAQAAVTVAALDLDVAREQVRVLLSLLEEGRSTRQAVDEARLAEQEKWLAFYDSEHGLEKAKLDLLKQTGSIQAALR